jgi:phosphocarrier protein
VLSEVIPIINKLGLHARAAAKFVSLASQFSCEIEVKRNNRRVNGKSIMGVMMLAAANGSEITLHITGEDEEQALSALKTLVNNRFGEAE